MTPLEQRGVTFALGVATIAGFLAVATDGALWTRALFAASFLFALLSILGFGEA